MLKELLFRLRVISVNVVSSTCESNNQSISIEEMSEASTTSTEAFRHRVVTSWNDCMDPTRTRCILFAKSEKNHLQWCGK